MMIRDMNKIVSKLLGTGKITLQNWGGKGHRQEFAISDDTCKYFAIFDKGYRNSTLRDTLIILIFITKRD